MVLVYRRAPSTSARLLTEALNRGGVPAKRVRTLARCGSNPIICWGEAHAGTRVLNGTPLTSKITDVKRLLAKGVPTITLAEGPGEGVLGRSKNHVGGGDLLDPPQRPDYYVRKETIVEEYRIHLFGGISIRAGRKIPREGAHEWIRSLDSGWWISYDGQGIRQKHRELARKAVEALGLDFGAVDLAKRRDGSLIVLEVNRAPGIEGNSLVPYVAHIKKWLGGNS